MAFISYLLQTVIKMILVGAVAVCGIFLGKNLRERKQKKTKE